MSMTEPCLCGADDCRYCYPNNFDLNGRYIDREAIADQEAKELHEERLEAMEVAIDHLNYHGLSITADVLQGIFEHLQKEGAQ